MQHQQIIHWVQLALFTEMYWFHCHIWRSVLLYILLQIGSLRTIKCLAQIPTKILALLMLCRFCKVANITSIHLPSYHLLVTFWHSKFPVRHLQKSKVAALHQKHCIFPLRKVFHQTLWLVYKPCTKSALLVSYKHLCTCNPVATSDNLLREYQIDSVPLSTETSKLLILHLNAKTYQLLICKSQWQRGFKII